MKNIVLVLLICIFAHVTAIAQTELSLSNAISRTLENNFQIQIAGQNTEIAVANNSWGLAGRFPSIQAGLTQSNRFDDNTTGKYSTNNLAPYINLNWTLFDGFRISITKDKLESLEEMSGGNTAMVVENVIQAVILAYYRIIIEMEKVKVYDSIVRLSSDRYQYVKQKREFGNALLFDELQAKVDYLNDSASRLLQVKAFHNAKRDLNLLMAEAPENDYILTDTLYSPEVSFDPDTLLKTMRNQNKSIKNLYLNQLISSLDVKIARSNYYPSLSLSAGFDHFNNRIAFKDNDPVFSNGLDYYGNLTLSFSVFNGYYTRNAVAIAQLKEKISKLETEELEMSLTSDLIDEYELYNIRKEIVDVARESLSSARLNMQISGEKFRNGTINSFNYRDIQLAYLNSSITLVESLFNLHVSYTEILRMTGAIVEKPY